MRNLVTVALLLFPVLGCGKPAEPVTTTDADRSGWRKLAKGMKPDSVRQLLGEPAKVETQGTVTCWHYQHGRPLERDAGDPNKWVVSRGSVLFSGPSADAGTLTAWREP